MHSGRDRKPKGRPATEEKKKQSEVFLVALASTVIHCYRWEGESLVGKEKERERERANAYCIDR